MQKTELHLRIISPSCTQYDNNVYMVVMPGTEGDFGVLPGHMPMIASLQKGTIRIHENEASIKEITITSGVASVSKNGVDIILEK